MKDVADVLVSVITPVYNSEKYIGDTIESVLAQTHQNWEMIIVDDCSCDDTEAIIRSYSDSRITYHKLDRNSGAAEARNVALSKANGRYVAFLDADDVWKPEKLSRQLEFMINKNIGFCFTAYEIMRQPHNKLVKVPPKLNYHQYMKNTVIGTLTVMIDRDIVGDIRLVNVRKDHDSMTWSKILREGILAYGLNESLALYRKVEGSISNDKVVAARTHWRNCRDIEKIPFWRCLYYFSFYAINAFIKHYF